MFAESGARNHVHNPSIQLAELVFVVLPLNDFRNLRHVNDKIYSYENDIRLYYQKSRGECSRLD
jgi:hypothetical protein